MPQLVWTPAALGDVQPMYRFLASKNPDAARRAVKAIRSGVATLSRHPQIGRPAEDLEPEFREWLIDFGSSGYIVLYHFDQFAVVILAVRHQKEAGY